MRRVVDELELYDEDDVGRSVPEESWDWEFFEKPFEVDGGRVDISEEINVDVNSSMKVLDLPKFLQKNLRGWISRQCQWNWID